jgi:DNA polymerase III epsilon subunit-like protein
MSQIEIYYCDVESTGLDFYKHSPIEISLIRNSTKEQKTWFLAPLDIENIDLDALKMNHNKYEDVIGKTKEGKLKYIDPRKVLIDIENWIVDDNMTTNERWLCGHNIAFDKYMLEFLWKKCNTFDSFPFGRRMLDTMQVQLLLDLKDNALSDNYTLSNCIKRYGIKNAKAHSAEADIKATSELFLKQISLMK